MIWFLSFPFLAAAVVAAGTPTATAVGALRVAATSGGYDLPNVRLSPESIEILVVLRMNREFIEKMRAAEEEKDLFKTSFKTPSNDE
jgi:hypothetical protein